MTAKSKKTIDFKILFILILICQSAGIIGSVFTASSIPTWYLGLDKPFFNPPNWIFGPVWLTLYTLMGISWYLVYKKEKIKRAFIFFGIHLIINTLWSIVFFGVRELMLGFIVIILLWIMIFISIVLFWKINKISAVLLIPYILWVSFASVLNYFLWILNS